MLLFGFFIRFQWSFSENTQKYLPRRSHPSEEVTLSKVIIKALDGIPRTLSSRTDKLLINKLLIIPCCPYSNMTTACIYLNYISILFI